jgi:hypothetical protein
MSDEASSAEVAAPSTAAPEQAPSAAPSSPQPMLPGPSHPYAVPASLAGHGVAQDFGRVMNAAGMPESVVSSVYAWADAGMPHQEFAGRDDLDHVDTAMQLRELWGDKADANLTRVRSYVRNNLPAELSQAMLGSARTADGRALGNDPAVLIRLHQLASQSPEVKSTGNLDADIKAIESVMRDNRDAYNRDQGLQMKLLGLYDARIKRDAK